MPETFSFEDAQGPPAAAPKTFSFEEAAPVPPPHTTAGGLAASAARGLAPYAAGAATGAALGAPFAGVGAIPGAALGAGAVGLTQLATGLYDALADKLGWSKTATPQEMTDKVLDLAGVQRPSTGLERVAETTAAGLAGGASGAASAATVAERAAPGAVKNIAERLAEAPGKQAASGALGGAAAQTTAEAGGGLAAQTIAATLAGGIPNAASAISAEPRPAALAARQAGYVLPPKSISEKPGLISNVLAGWSGKIKTQQAASAKNQAVTNELAAKALGLPPDTVLTDQVLENVRRNASAAYKTVANAVPAVTVDPAFDNAITALGGRNSQAAKMFPKITNNPGIQDMIDELKSVTDIPTDTAVELVRELRFNANANLKALGDPSKHALGLAQREAANALDDLMDRTIAASGKPGVVDAYRQARTLIAKAYDVESVTNTTTGDVNARGLGRLMDKGRPLSGELKTIADAALAFPKAMQAPSGFGDNEPWSALDFFGSAAAATHGNPGVAGAILARPAARAVLLSKPYQNSITGTPKFSPLPLVTQPGVASVVPPNLQGVVP